MTIQTIEKDVLAMGYGIIPKMVMKDPDLSIEAKAIYSYISSYAGAGNTAFPSVSLICHDLKIGKDRFQKHKKSLLEKGYLVIEKEKENGKFTHNLYVISQTIAQMEEKKQKATEPKNPLPDFEAVEDSAWEQVMPESNATNNNSANNNSFNNNNLLDEKDDDSQINLFQEKITNRLKAKWHYHFGKQHPFTPQIQEGLERWLNCFQDEEVIDHALHRAGRYGAKSYQYLDSILRNWRDEGMDTIEEIYDREIAEKSKRY